MATDDCVGVIDPLDTGIEEVVTDADDAAAPTDVDDAAAPTDVDGAAAPTDVDDAAAPTDVDDPETPTDDDDVEAPTDADDVEAGVADTVEDCDIETEELEVLTTDELSTDGAMANEELLPLTRLTHRTATNKKMLISNVFCEKIKHSHV